MFSTLVSTRSDSEPYISQVTKPPFEVDRELKHLACLPCRNKKLRCTGERTGCQRCLERGLKCEYQEWNPNRNRRQRGTSTNDNKDSEPASDNDAVASMPHNLEGEEVGGGLNATAHPASSNAPSENNQEGVNPEFLSTMHEIGDADFQLSDILLTPDPCLGQDGTNILFNPGSSTSSLSDVANHDMLLFSQLTSGLAGSTMTHFSSPSREGIPASLSHLTTKSNKSITQSIHMPSCTCRRSTLALYESLRAVHLRAQRSTDTARGTAYLILKASKLALNQCHRFLTCPSCKEEPLFVTLLCSVCEQCLNCFEIFYDLQPKRLGNDNFMLSSTRSLRVNSPLISDMDQTDEIAQLAILPFEEMHMALDDEDNRILLNTRVISMVHLLRKLGPLVDSSVWRTHHGIFDSLQKRCQGLAFKLQAEAK